MKTNECKLVESDLLVKYLTKEAKEVLEHKVHDTVIELTQLVDNKEGEVSDYARVAYFVEFLSVLLKEPPTEIQIEKFCEKINFFVENNILFFGTLALPFYMKLFNGDYMLNTYIVSKVPFKQLKKDYPDLFVNEGELPKEYLDNL